MCTMLDAKTYLTLSTFKQHPQQHDIDLFIFHNNIYVWNHKVNKNKGQNVGLACLKHLDTCQRNTCIQIS